MELKKKIHECEMLSEASRQPLSIPEKTPLFVAFFQWGKESVKKDYFVFMELK